MNNCREDCNNGLRYEKCENFVFFGTYPQTDVTDRIGNVLSSYVLTKPTDSNSDGWISYKYYIDGESSFNYAWYKDVEYNGEKYRAVYFSQYRPSCISDDSTIDNTNQKANGYLINSVYWFKFEKIKWRILAESDDKAILFSEFILDSQEYDASNNCYKSSSIRKWLNDDFYNLAFNEIQKDIIEVVTVDNSVSSTMSDINPYACENTLDKIWLLSRTEALTESYGFSHDKDKYDEMRKKSVTDYAKCMGVCALPIYAFKGRWWLSSPSYYDKSEACYVYSRGNFDIDGNIENCSYGVVPAVKITL